MKSVWKAQASSYKAKVRFMAEETAKLAFLGGLLRKFSTMKDRGATIVAELKVMTIEIMIRNGLWEYFPSRRTFVKLVYKPTVLGSGIKGSENMAVLAEVLGPDVTKDLVTVSLDWVPPQPGGMTSSYTLDVEAFKKLSAKQQLAVFEKLGYPSLTVEDPPLRAKAGKRRNDRKKKT